MIDENGIKYIDFRFTDPLGTWQHFSNHINTFEMDVFEEGIGFDGSSIRCFQSIEASDMILIPDIEPDEVTEEVAEPKKVKKKKAEAAPAEDPDLQGILEDWADDDAA